MGYISAPDPDPGRCRNFRTVTHSDGHIETLRCLDYEGAPHQCTFPKPKHVTAVSHNIFSSGTDQPKPWVKPDSNEE